MAWIEVHQSLLTHRKTLRLCRLLKMDKFAVTGRLIGLWCWALDNAPDGVLPLADIDILGDVMGWEGEPRELLDALISVGFVDRASEDGFQIHDWQDYAGKLIDRRKSEAARKRSARLSESARRTSAGHPQDVPKTSFATVPYPTIPNHTLHPTKGSVVIDIEKRGKEGRAAEGRQNGFAANPPPPSSSFLQNLPPEITQRFSPQQLEREYERASVWVKDHPRSRFDQDFFIDKWLAKIKPDEIVPPNESKIKQLKRHLARFTPERTVVDGKTYAAVAEELREARAEEEKERLRERSEAWARWKETSLVDTGQNDPADQPG